MAEYAEVPPATLSFASLVNRLRRQDPKYSYAQTRLGRGPMIIADPAQYEEFSPGHLGDVVKSVPAANISPLAEPVQSFLARGEQPIVMGQWDPMSMTPSTDAGSVGQVARHESTHQFMGETKLPLDVLYSRIPEQFQQLIRGALLRQGYSPTDFSSEIPARLAAGQFSSLGLTEDQGRAVWKTYLDLYQQQQPKNAARLRLYTKKNK